MWRKTPINSNSNLHCNLLCDYVQDRRSVFWVCKVLPCMPGNKISIVVLAAAGRITSFVVRFFHLNAKLSSLRDVYGVESPTVGTTSSSRLHICAVTYMTRISMHVTLNIKKTQIQTSTVIDCAIMYKIFDQFFGFARCTRTCPAITSPLSFSLLLAESLPSWSDSSTSMLNYLPMADAQKKYGRVPSP